MSRSPIGGGSGGFPPGWRSVAGARHRRSLDMTSPLDCARQFSSSRRLPSCRLLLPIEPAAHGFKRLAREDGLEREPEILGDPERELQAGVVVATLQISHGLVVDAQGLCQLLPGESVLCPQHRNSILNRRSHTPNYCISTIKERS